MSGHTTHIAHRTTYTLQVGRDAVGGRDRDAYRRLNARRHHPDRSGRDDAVMASINEAYRVLGEPARRAVYDASLRPPRSDVPSPPRRLKSASRVGSPNRGHRALPPARYPWKLVLAMFVLGVSVVLIGVALYEPRLPNLRPTTCSDLDPVRGDRGQRRRSRRSIAPATRTSSWWTRWSTSMGPLSDRISRLS